MHSLCSPVANHVYRLAGAVGVALAVVACGDGSLAESSGSAQGPATSRAKPPQQGALRRWPEATAYLLVNLDTEPSTVALGAARRSGMDLLWSIASTRAAGSAFFYSDLVRGTDETRVAGAAGVRRVQEIRDASTLDYAASAVGPVPVGGIVVVHHRPSDRYLAIVLDAIEPVDQRSVGSGPYAYADVTWYLTDPGGTDFSSAF